MLRSTFLRLESYKLYFFICFLISNAIAAVLSQSGIIPDIVPGVPIPDIATLKNGTILVPSQILSWYSLLERMDQARKLYFWITVVDFVAIIPSYTLWLGCEIAPLSQWAGILCHIPVCTALFDILETATHFFAIQDRYLHRTDVGFAYWTPPTGLLAAACLATPLKFLGIFVCLTIVAFGRWKSRSEKSKLD
ncbi:hypothetical protein IV203_004292 [Nitzschia inconspicua]|uniref:EXPERA domain-containing protein n=1 Tax=Nitzschia inconspicua TaxID=303405 RepID=A0A9K3L4Z6_9STRA|nr:hypothetical protein IV203_004292 [Nitzschia inconspicua]